MSSTAQRINEYLASAPSVETLPFRATHGVSSDDTCTALRFALSAAKRRGRARRGQGRGLLPFCFHRLQPKKDPSTLQGSDGIVAECKGFVKKLDPNQSGRYNA